MNQESCLYAAERVRAPDGRRLVIEYRDDRCMAAARSHTGRVSVEDIDHHLRAVVRENGATLFTVAQVVTKTISSSARTPREQGTDAILRQDVIRRLRAGAWQTNADYSLPQMG
jgi:hypothetical protein